MRCEFHARWRALAIPCLALLVLLPGPGPAHAEERDGEIVRRLVIALHDADVGGLVPDFDHPVWSVLQMPLNHLGMDVRIHDIRTGPPPAKWLPKTRAVLTWFRVKGTTPDWLWPWLEEHVKPPEMRVIHLQDLGCLEATPADRKRLGPYLQRLGLAWHEGYVGQPLRIETTLRSEALCALERDPRRYAEHRGPSNESDANTAWVITRDRSHPDDVRTPVVTGPWGGLALSPWTLALGTEEGSRRWLLDPFAFLRDALGLNGTPVPHPSVLNGRRMFIFHVDGDGFESLSTVRPNTLAAKVFLDDVLDAYKLPATVSIIVASLTKDIGVETPTESMELAKEILNRPYVEAASHGVLHPYKWMAEWSPGNPPKEYLPYKELKGYDYSPVAEVRDSIRFINERLLEGGKRCRVMLWTGDTHPPRDAILECLRHDAMNMNGGTFRWDAAYDSVGYVSPWVRRNGEAIQVTAGAANENEFPGYFTTNPTSYRHIDTTIRRTGKGRILKPANIYVHFYSAERPPRLTALKQLLDRWALREPTVPVYASTYTAAVLGSLDAEIRRTASGWALRGFGGCRTVRLDGEPRSPDLDNCRGVLGWRRIDESLYVHLAGAEADLALDLAPSRRPYLHEANHIVRDVALEPKALTLVSEGLVKRVVVVGGLPRNGSVAVVIGGKEETRKADAEGLLSLKLPVGGPDRVEVRVP